MPKVHTEDRVAILEQLVREAIAVLDPSTPPELDHFVDIRDWLKSARRALGQ